MRLKQYAAKIKKTNELNKPRRFCNFSKILF